MSISNVYNTYLSVSRGYKNKPWKPRKDFHGFEKTPDGILCTRLDMFFDRFPQISMKDFFLAPYILYKDEEWFQLNFYLTQKAISCYSLVQKQKLEELPDSESHIKDIKTSLEYIAKECCNSKLTVAGYSSVKNGYTWKCVQDYNNNKINIYVLLSLPNFDSIFDNLELQDKQLYFKNIYIDIAKYKTRLNNSTRAKKIITEVFKRIDVLV